MIAHFVGLGILIKLYIKQNALKTTENTLKCEKLPKIGLVAAILDFTHEVTVKEHFGPKN